MKRSFADNCRFVERQTGRTQWMERWMGATGKGKEKQK